MKGLSEKQKGFIRDTIKYKNPTKAAKLNYDIGSKGGSKTPKQAENTAGIIAFENINKPKIAAVLNKHGITPDYLTKELRENIENTKKDKYYNANLKGIELGYKLTGHLNNSDDKTVNIAVIGYINSSELKKLPKEAINGDYKEIKQE
jgi:hypothetical protein